jgi:cation diffusion facilitator family transporter
VSVISEAIHSGVDLIAAGIALSAVRASGKPADQEHPFGHGKIENISGAIEALLIFLAAGWIIVEAAQRLMHREAMESALPGVLVMAASATANFFVSRALFRVGKETDSIALQADGWHLRTDVWTSAGVMCGLLVIKLTRLLIPSVDLWWLDPIVAIAVAMLIVKADWELTTASLRDVLDTSLPPDELKVIEGLVRAHPATRGYHRLSTRRAGPERFIEFHLFVDGASTVDDSHRATDELTASIREKLPGARVTIHVEPVRPELAKKSEPSLKAAS